MPLMRRVRAPLSSMALHIVLPSRASVRSWGANWAFQFYSAREVLPTEAHQHVADDSEAGHQILTAHAPTAKACTDTLGEILGPLAHVLVAACPAQGRGGEHHEQGVAAALTAARIKHGAEEIRQELHLGGGEHPFGHAANVGARGALGTEAGAPSGAASAG